MSIFITCIVDNDLSGLTISGTISDEELKNIWDSIKIEYFKLSNNDAYKAHLNKLTALEVMASTIDRIRRILLYISKYGCNPELIAQLNKDRIKIEEKNLQKSFDRAVNKLKMMEVDYNAKYEDLNKKGEEKPYTRIYFDKWLLDISKYEGYMISAETITVSKFCLCIQRLAEYSRQMEEQKERNRA